MKIVKISNSIAFISFLLLCFCCQNQPRQAVNKQNKSAVTAKQVVDTATVESHRQVAFYNKKKYVCLDALNEPRLDHEVSVTKKSKGDYAAQLFSVGSFYQENTDIKADTTFLFEMFFYRFNTHKNLVLMEEASYSPNRNPFYKSDTLKNDTLILQRGYYRANFYTYYIFWQKQTKHFHLVRQESNSYGGGNPYHYRCVSNRSVLLNDTLFINDIQHNFTNSECFEVWAADEINDMQTVVTGNPNWLPKMPFFYDKYWGRRQNQNDTQLTKITNKTDWDRYKKTLHR